MNCYYVYILLDPRKSGNFVYGNYQFSLEPMYVGRSGVRYPVRIKQHFIQSSLKKKDIKSNIILKVFESGYGEVPHIVVGKDLAFEESKELENSLVDKIGCIKLGTGPLTNLTKGGEGVPKDSFSLSKSTREKQRLSHLGEKNHFFGKTHTNEARRKISETRKDPKKHPIARGEYRHSDETRRKMSEGKTGEKHNLYGFNHREESKAMISSSMKKICENEEFKQQRNRKRAESLLRKYMEKRLPFDESTYMSNKPHKFAPSYSYLVSILDSEFISEITALD